MHVRHACRRPAQKPTRKIINPHLIMTFDIYVVLFYIFRALYMQYVIGPEQTLSLKENLPHSPLPRAPGRTGCGVIITL